MSDCEILRSNLSSLNTYVQASTNGRIKNLEIESQFDSGQSNPTYLMKAGARRLVLRKQPSGDLPPRAHDVAREHDIMLALGQQGFPVPQPLLVSRSADAIGTQFFLMDYIEGLVHSDPALPDESPQGRQATYAAMADTLARLHNLDPAILESAHVRPRPDYVGRQVAIWRSQYLASLTDTNTHVESLAAWLLDHKPDEGAQTIVHGDYRIENLIMQDARVAAVLDWELCAIGEPLCDLAYCCIWYHFPHEVLGGLADLDLDRLGIPSEEQFIARYANGRRITVSRSAHDYYLAFAFYRLAAILQRVYRRALDGNSASSQALSRGKIAQLCLEKALVFAARA